MQKNSSPMAPQRLLREFNYRADQDEHDARSSTASTVASRSPTTNVSKEVINSKVVAFESLSSGCESCVTPNRQDDCFRMNCDGCPYRRASVLQKAIVVITFLLVTACSQFDPHADTFQQIGLGDSRARVVAVMGRPESVNSVEIPLIKAEQMAWRAPMKGRVYIILIVMDHVAAKCAVD